jgi:Tol biopolymer transport system component/predicted Ser/Thr protein kinase
VHPDSQDSFSRVPDEVTVTQIGVGQQVGPYLIEALLGSGGMGQVFRARDTRLGRSVAIKVSHEKFSARFEREARAIAALNHPHICSLFDVGSNYLVMELVEGTPLHGPIGPEKAVEYAMQIIDALDEAHRKGIVHRDLKPGNILVTKQGIKILDFGLAHMASGPADPTLTHAGAVMGTPAYMAPEQWEGKPADTRSDIYAFGCVLYEMLSGKRATQDASGLDSAPLVLATIVRACLEKDPEDRWQSARDVKRALALPAPATRRKRGSWFAAIAAAAVVSAIAGWAVEHFRSVPEPARVIRYQLNPPEGGAFIFGLAFDAGGIAAAPDGSAIAYVAAVNGKIGLWLQTLDNLGPRLLPGTTNAQYPFWSPDSSSIAFFSGKKLLQINPSGGAPLVICDLNVYPRGGAWSDQGEILIGAQDAGLMHVPAAGGKAAPLMGSNPLGQEVFPQALPQGKFLFSAGTFLNPQAAGLYVSSLSHPSEHTQLLAGISDALYAPGAGGKHFVLWSRGSTLLAQELDVNALKLIGDPRPVVDPVVNLNGALDAAVSANGLLAYGTSNLNSRFTWFDRDGGMINPLGETGEYNSFRLSPDGRRAAVTRTRPDGSDLWLLDTERGLSDKFTAVPGVAAYPVWAPDGRTLVFSIPAASGALSLFRKPVGGTGMPEQITPAPTLNLATDWSPDGKYLVYFSIGAGTHEDLWYLEMTPDGRPTGAPKVYLAESGTEIAARFSPSSAAGRWLAYQSDRSGEMEVYIDSFPEPRQSVRVSTGGGLYPQWSSDGHELFYLSPDYKLMAVTLKISPISIEPSSPRELFPLSASVTNWNPFEVSPDGKRFLVRAAAGHAPPVNVVLNWPALLK